MQPRLGRWVFGSVGTKYLENTNQYTRQRNGKHLGMGAVASKDVQSVLARPEKMYSPSFSSAKSPVLKYPSSSKAAFVFSSSPI